MLSAAKVDAAPTTFHVSGSVAGSSFPDYHVLPGVAPGDAIVGEFTYDPDAGTLQTLPSSFDFQVGQLRFRSGSDGIVVNAAPAAGPNGPNFSLQSGGLGATISSDARLIDVFTLLQLQNGTGTLHIAGLVTGNDGPAHSFDIDGAVSVAPQGDLAPEPSSLGLILPGIAALGLFLRRGRLS